MLTFELRGVASPFSPLSAGGAGGTFSAPRLGSFSISAGGDGGCSSSWKITKPTSCDCLSDGVWGIDLDGVDVDVNGGDGASFVVFFGVGVAGLLSVMVFCAAYSSAKSLLAGLFPVPKSSLCNVDTGRGRFGVDVRLGVEGPRLLPLGRDNGDGSTHLEVGGGMKSNSGSSPNGTRLGMTYSYNDGSKKSRSDEC